MVQLSDCSLDANSCQDANISHTTGKPKGEATCTLNGCMFWLKGSSNSPVLGRAAHTVPHVPRARLWNGDWSWRGTHLEETQHHCLQFHRRKRKRSSFRWPTNLSRIVILPSADVLNTGTNSWETCWLCTGLSDNRSDCLPVWLRTCCSASPASVNVLCLRALMTSFYSTFTQKNCGLKDQSAVWTRSGGLPGLAQPARGM